MHWASTALGRPLNSAAAALWLSECCTDGTGDGGTGCPLCCRTLPTPVFFSPGVVFGLCQINHDISMNPELEPILLDLDELFLLSDG